MLVKLKEVHFLNAPPFMDKLMMVLKPFMKNSLLRILQIHEINSQVIYKYVPKEAFPRDCGGSYKDFKTLRGTYWNKHIILKTSIRVFDNFLTSVLDETIRRLESNREFFKQENLRRVNESLRRNGETKTIEDIFGIQGSFKKLDID